MPANGLNGVRDNVVQVVNAAAYTFNRTDTYAAVSEVPASGTALLLPTNPQAGDRYEFSCTDGSCSADSPITLETQDRSTIQGEASVSLTQAYAWGVLIYQGGVAAPGTWMLYSEASSEAPSANYTQIGENNAGFNFTAQTCGAGNVCIAAVMVPVKGSGVFKATWSLPWICGTAAENITIAPVVVPFAAGAFGSGTTTGSAGALVADSLLAPDAQTNAALARYARYLAADAGGATAAAGITFDGVPVNGSAAGSIIVGPGMTAPTLAGLLTGSGSDPPNDGLYTLAGSAIVSKSTGPKVPFAAGTMVVLGLVLNGTAGLITFAGLSLLLEELPQGAS